MNRKMSQNTESISNERFERKFYLPTLPFGAFEVMLKHHPMRFREVYPQRYVNNIYLDTFDFENYSDNVVGVSKRMKVRIRWYGVSKGAVLNPRLELKIKKNMLGTKKIFQLNELSIDEELSKPSITKLFESSNISHDVLLYLKSLDVVLMNGYTRKYFCSSNGKYRITVDLGVDYYRLYQLRNSFLHKATTKYGVIVELKYDKDYDGHAKYITCHFPFRVSKISKYVEGVKKLGIC